MNKVTYITPIEKCNLVYLLKTPDDAWWSFFYNCVFNL